MTKVELVNNVSRAFHKVGFELKKHSPEIFVVAGVIGTVASAVMACRATLKVNETLEQPKKNIDKIHTAVEKGVTEIGESYSVEDSKKDLVKVYAHTGVQFAKLYGPSVALGAVSIASILAGHNLLHKRNVALAAAYATIDQGFKDYRNRVVERFGKELDKELRYGIKAQEVTETVVNEDGTEQTVTNTVDVIDKKNYSGYARCFDETCAGWDRDAERNLFYLIQVQNMMNEKLQRQGYLFLNDVYKALGMQMSVAGQTVGWIYDEKHPVGDNFVDFGIHDLHDKEKRLFVNGYEKSIWLDFNVDGDILHQMPWENGFQQ